jgi:hypothetical protein
MGLPMHETLNLAQDFLSLRAEIDQWLDATFADVLGGFGGSQIFYGQAVLRLFRPIVEGFPTSMKSIEKAGAADKQRNGSEMRREPGEQNGASLGVRAHRKRLSWPLLVLLSGIAAFFGTVLYQVRAYVKESRSRVSLRRLRSRDLGTFTPRFWVVLVPDWIRINLHVLESVVKPALQCGERLGVLLSGTLQAGARMESNMRVRTGSGLWPGLGLLEKRLDECTVDQVVSPQSVSEFVTVCVRTFRQTIRVLLRLARCPSQIRSGEFQFDLAKHKWQLAKLVTMDIWSAIAAERATHEVVERYSFAGATVILVGTAPSSLATTDLILQNAGATTVDFDHGSAGDWLSNSPSCSTLRCVWTRADAASVAPLGQPTIVAGTPRTVTKKIERPNFQASNVLIASNYSHRDSRAGSSFPECSSQEVLLDVVGVIRENFGQRFHFRWRPHPADDEEAVGATLKLYSRVELSRGNPLEEDVAWADLIITSTSSTVAQFLLAEIPVFLHVPFSRQHSSAVACFTSERKFLQAHDLQLSFVRCIAAMDAGDQSALAPERHAREAFFGPSGEPVSLFDLLTNGSLQPSKTGDA